MNKLFLLLVVIFFLSCVNESTKKKNEANTTVVEKRDMSDLGPLYINFHANPQTQDQKDENAIIDYAADNNLNAKKLASGMYYILHKEGTGNINLHGQPFKAHYSGYFFDGKVFDSSVNKDPIMAKVGQMNAGWNEALKTFKIGSKLTLLIPSRLAYGERGFPGYVPPNTPLAFDMEILPLVN